jgi:dihydroorotate dehydrogenase electron transfer subunit
MVQVTGGLHPLLRRPFSIHDARGTRIEIFFQVVGRGTRLLAAGTAGARLNLLGPLGRGFSTEEAGEAGAALLGGGRGIAPLYFLGRVLKEAGIRVRTFYGGRAGRDLPLADRLRAAGLDPLLSTDDGSLGFKGTVLDRFLAENSPPPDVLYACGPEPMLRAVDAAARARDIPAQLSLEAIMGCGFGACWGCVHRIRQGGETAWRKTCQDGPVFRAGEVVWPEGNDD